MTTADHPLLTRNLLTRAPHKGRASLPVTEDMALALGRVHEICGHARRTLALTVAARLGHGPVFWIAPGWAGERLNGEGVTEWMDPGRLVLVHPDQSDDLLWAMEECLRAGGAPLVVAELPVPPALTPVRRLHLAAEAGCGAGRAAPLGLLLTPGEGGAAGVESRWSLDPGHDKSDAQRWSLRRMRERAMPPGTWALSAKRGPDTRWQLAAHATSPTV